MDPQELKEDHKELEAPHRMLQRPTSQDLIQLELASAFEVEDEAPIDEEYFYMPLSGTFCEEARDSAYEEIGEVEDVDNIGVDDDDSDDSNEEGDELGEDEFDGDDSKNEV